MFELQGDLLPNGEKRDPLSVGYWMVVEKRALPSTCKGCGKRIFWAKTRGGKNMPIDCGTDGAWEPTNTDTGYGRSHFETCIKADEFSGWSRATPARGDP